MRRSYWIISQNKWLIPNDDAQKNYLNEKLVQTFRDENIIPSFNVVFNQ